MDRPIALERVLLRSFFRSVHKHFNFLNDLILFPPIDIPPLTGAGELAQGCRPIENGSKQ